MQETSNVRLSVSLLRPSLISTGIYKTALTQVGAVFDSGLNKGLAEQAFAPECGYQAVLDQHFHGWSVPEEIRGTRSSPIGTCTENSDQIADICMWQFCFVRQTIQRSA